MATAHPITTALPEYALVRLRGDRDTPDGLVPGGSTGVIVWVHDNGAAYEVEFDTPVRTVVTLTTADFEA